MGGASGISRSCEDKPRIQRTRSKLQREPQVLDSARKIPRSSQEGRRPDFRALRPRSQSVSHSLTHSQTRADKPAPVSVSVTLFRNMMANTEGHVQRHT